MACVLIDVDGTLVEGPSTERSFVAYLFRQRALRSRQVAAGLAFFLRWGVRYGLCTPNKNKAYLAGLKVSEVQRLAELFVDKNVIKRLRPAVVNRLKEHREAGEPVGLVTGAPDFIVRPLADHLGAQGFSATVCAQEDGVFTADPPLVHPFGWEKLNRARKLCKQLGCELSQSVAYADALYDLPLLQHVAKPIVVHPGRRLRQIADKAGWEIIEDS